ncbi:TolC family protein [Sphingomonas sp. CGMCC 1.13654]|uniref:TolC family protein n=1 Tax=Sphingomonas chungangi TaxID=2683589 RepID=A0A838L5F7_9SPHN|nr:TolC family protein [Sphingomonas chungangi]MVW58034.1 efflux transporter outer membrane subunit [Sphingomonas chungangi]
MRRAFAALAVASLLAGCTVGPNYHVPDRAMAKSPAANRPFMSGQEAMFDQSPLPDRWWTLYGDPRLDGYLREALTANTDLRAADANLRRASEVVREAEAGRTVQTKIETAAFGAYVGGYTLTVPLDLPYSAVASASIDYPLDLAGGIKRGIEAAKEDREAVEAARDQVRVTIAAAVTRSYADVCSANVTLAATRHVLDVQTQTLSSINRLFKGGRGTAFDVTRARTAADKSAAAIPEIIAARQASLYELAALMGRAPSDYPVELESCAEPPKLDRPMPIGDGTALIRRRPDIRASERQLAAATAGIGVQMAKLYPQVSLAGSAGFANSISNFFTGSSFGGFAGPLISWAFPNRKAIHAEIAQAGDAADAASAKFDGTVIEALRQTETALDAYAREIEHDGALEKTRDDAAKSTDQANKLFRYGRTDVLNVLTAQANLAEAEAALAQSRATLIDRQVNVFLALGGGWEDAPTAPVPGQLSPNSSR